MTTPATGREAETGQQAEARMRAVAAELAAAGLDASVHETRGVLDVRASLRPAGLGPVEVILDGDGYVAVSYWHAPGTTPAQVATTINGVLAVITNQAAVA